MRFACFTTACVDHYLWCPSEYQTHRAEIHLHEGLCSPGKVNEESLTKSGNRENTCKCTRPEKVMTGDSPLLCQNFLDDVVTSPADYFRAMGLSRVHNAIVSDIQTDTYLIKDFPGGEAVNIAVHLRRIGMESAYIGGVGTDDMGDILLDFLGSSQVDLSHACRIKGETAQNGIRTLENGEKYEVPGTWINGAYKSFRMSEEDWSFLNTFDAWITHIYCPGFDETVARVPENIKLAADFLESGNVQLLEKYKDRIDFAFFSGPREIENDLKKISETSDCICALTLGSEGSIVFSNGEQFIQDALPAEKPLDSTGCGDAYIAGFLGTYLQNHDIPAAMLKGAELGRDTVEHFGAIS